MRSFKSMSGTEAFYDEPDSAFSGQNFTRNLTAGMTDTAAGMGTTSQSGNNPAALNPISSASSTGYDVGQGMTTANAEALGDADANAFNQMAFSIEKVTVTAKSRALKAEYSLELAQDLKAIHGLNAEQTRKHSLHWILLRSTAKLSEPSIRLLNRVLHKTSLSLVYLTLTSTPTDAGVLRSSRVSLPDRKRR